MDPLQTPSDILAKSYDAILFDLDGVIYIGTDAVAGVVPAINDVQRNYSVALTYVTNNASRSSQSVSEHLNALGLVTTADDVVTSAQAGAAELAKRIAPGSRVFVLGSKDLMHEVELVGLVPTQEFDLDVAALIQGYWPDMPWRMLAQACAMISAGALWVATNMDATIPTQWGVAPGNGSMVQMLSTTLGRTPDVVAGKPEAPLMMASVNRTGAKRALMVGDRLDTDILGATHINIDSLLVLSGVTTVSELFLSPPALRPTFLGWDALALNEVQPAVVIVAGQLTCEQWRLDGESIVGSGDILNAIRLCAVAVWQEKLTPGTATHELARRGFNATAVRLPEVTS